MKRTVRLDYALGVLTLGLAVVPYLRAQQAAPMADWKGRIEAIRAGFAGDMAVYAKNLGTGETLAIDADHVHETFSVIKVPIMAEVMRQAAAGEYKLADRLTYRAEHARLPSGVLYAMDPGLQPTIKDLITLMIVISDNSATDLLGDKAGRDRVTAFMRKLGLEHTAIAYSDLEWDRRWLSRLDPSYRQATGDKTVAFPFERYPDGNVAGAFRETIEHDDIFFGRSTAREMGTVFELMARGELVSKSASELMIQILKKQQVNNRIPRYLSNVEIAHKTGDGQPTIGNDAGILWIKETPVVLVIFTAHHRGSTEALHDAVARAAANVAEHFGAAVEASALLPR